MSIEERLPGLANILRAEMMALHHTLRLLTTTYQNEPAHIFTDCINVIYLLKNHIKHPTTHNSHPDKVTLASMVQMLLGRTQITTIHKVRAHANIDGNEQADKLAKRGRKLEHEDAEHPYEHAHPAPYYFQKDWWHSMDQTPDKGPICFLEKHIIKHDKKHNLNILATNFPNIDKWIANEEIDDKLSNEFWKNPIITDAQKTCLLKFRTGQYMGHARKQLFFGIEAYPSITCPICNSTDPDTWFHVLLKCQQQHIHALITKRHNKAVWELRKLLISSKKSRCFTLMNAGTFNDNPQENTVPPWLLTCTCGTQRCHCNARFKPDMLCVQGLPYQQPPPEHPDPNLTIQFIEFTYCNDRFSVEAMARKTDKYQPLLNNIAAMGWKVAPLIVITAGARASTHIPSIKILEKTFSIPITSINNTFRNINTIAIQYAMNILLHKRRLESHQPLPTSHDPP